MIIDPLFGLFLIYVVMFICALIVNQTEEQRRNRW